MELFKKAGFVYILLIHLVLALVFLRPDIIRRIEVKLGIPGSQLKYFHNKMVGYHRGMDSSIPDNAVLFIGDSITQSLATSAISPYSVNLGIGSDTTSGVLNRLGIYNAIDRAKLVVIGIGINDLHQNVSSIETQSNYRKILESIPSNISVLVTSVLPIGLNAEKKRFNNESIHSLNLFIESTVEAFENVTYLNSHTALADHAGYLKPAHHNGDGIHLSDEGYQVLIEQLKNRLSQISQ